MILIILKNFINNFLKYLFIMIILSFVLSLNSCKKEKEVELVFSSWRSVDQPIMENILTNFTKKYPHIKVKFTTTIVEGIHGYVYNLEKELAAGLGPDIIFTPSFSLGKRLYDRNYLLRLNDKLSELNDISQTAINAWKAENGDIYALPSVGVIHGVYYRKDIFKKYNLKEPKTWNEFINICEILKKKKVTVFSQGSLAVWTLYEIIFSGLGANFYGGERARQQLIAGKLKLTSPQFVKAFKKINQLKKYFPENYKHINYTAMQQFFINGEAAMFIGGSWELALFKKQNIMDKLDWFAPPVEKTGDQVQLCFHIDAAISLNKNSKHPEEALLFLKWAASQEYAKLFMDNLPGFITYTKGDFKIKNRMVEKMVKTAQDSQITIRTTWEKLSDQKPTGNQMLAKAIQQMYNNRLTPEQAAKFVQDKLEEWYMPFKK